MYLHYIHFIIRFSLFFQKLRRENLSSRYISEIGSLEIGQRENVRVAAFRERVYGRKNIFGFYRDRTLCKPASLGSPSRARESPLKGGRRSRRSKFRGGAFCPRDVLHLLSFYQRGRPFFFVLLSLLSFAFPSRYQNCRRERTEENA